MQKMTEPHSVSESPNNISITLRKLAMIESAHKHNFWRFRLEEREREKPERETGGMETEAGLFFSQTGKCSLHYLALIAIRGTCTASITRLGEKTEPRGAVEAPRHKANIYVCSSASLWWRTLCTLPSLFDSGNAFIIYYMKGEIEIIFHHLYVCYSRGCKVM